MQGVGKRIAYVTAYDAHDIGAWSGIGYYMAQALLRVGHDISYLGPLREPYKVPLKLKQLFYKLVLRQQHLRDREPATVRSYAYQTAHILAKTRSDIVFSPGTLPIAYLETDKPVVFWTDATFAGVIDLYPWATHLSRPTLEHGHRIEQAALEKCSLAIYSSDWAAESARTMYGAAPQKVKVVPFGANIDIVHDLDDIRRLIAARAENICTLLFLGVDWLRKGGDIALEVAIRLNASGLPTQLLVVGCKPEVQGPIPHFVRQEGFLSKSTPSGRKRIEKLFAEAHFLILPTRADCTPVVFCEANAFGVPCLSTDVGGIATSIRNGVNGQVFASNAAVEEYCAFIRETFLNRGRYAELALSSFNEYTERLNWNNAAETVHQLLMEM